MGVNLKDARVEVEKIIDGVRDLLRLKSRSHLEPSGCWSFPWKRPVSWGTTTSNEHLLLGLIREGEV